jgi:hypothetical protein
MHFAVGDIIILKVTNIRTKRPCKKLDAKYLSPFTIKAKVRKLSYRIALPPLISHIHLVFHVSLLKKWERLRDSLNFKPGPTKHPEIEDEKRYKVEAILAHRMAKNKL